MDTPVAQVVRVAPRRHWHALEDDLVVGRAYALHRPDGRSLISVDTWRDDVFEVLAAAVVADLGTPVYTVVDDDDREVLGRWTRAGFRDHRREDVLAVPTASRGPERPTAYRIESATHFDEALVRALDQEFRAQAAGTVGWVNEPAEFHEYALSPRVLDPSTFLLATADDGSPAGLVRIARAGRRPRLVIVGVREPHRRRGLATALLRRAFRSLHDRGVTHVTADVDETDRPTQRLLRGLGAERVGGAVELVR